MRCFKPDSAGRRFLFLSMLGCALLLLDAAWAPGAAAAQAAAAPDSAQGAGSAQEVQVITRAGQK